MRLIFLTFFSCIIIAVASTNAIAQTGSLGDPIYTEDFGSGPNPGPALPLSNTNLTYTTGCPDDGFYTLVNSLNNSNNCHTDTWQNIPQDHTGNPNGYMMLINAKQNLPNQAPGVFFTVPVPVGQLCPNTTYQFSVYVLNLIKQSAGPGFFEPDITFTITAPDGTPLAKPYDTGPIAPNDPSQSPWKQFSTTFTTLPNITSVIVSMVNNVDGGTGNDLVIDDISFRAYGPAITPGFNNNNSPVAPLICAGDPADFTVNATIQQGVFDQPMYQWQQYNTATGWVDIPGEIGTSMARHFQPAVAGIYQYRIGAANGTNIQSDQCRVYSNPLTVTVYDKPVITGVNPATPPVCVGDVLTLNAGGGTDYVWTKPDGSTTTVNPLIIQSAALTDAGTYSVTATNPSGCTSPPVSTQVTVNARPNAMASVAGSSSICEGTTATLHATGGVAYSWSPGKTLSDSTSSDPVASPTDTTAYTVTVTNSSGCISTAATTVNVLKAPVANAGPDKVIFEGQSVQLAGSAQYADTYSWTPTDYLSNPNILNPIATPVDDITYTLHVTSSVNCGSAESSVFIRVYKKITIPNTFSPNGDGINDYWNIEALVTYPESLMMVYDRNGQQVYRSIGYSKPWDGKYNGQTLPAGTYYYVLDLKNNTPKISGWVFIAR